MDKQAAVAPLTLTADQANVLFHDGEKIVCLDRKDGRRAGVGPRARGASRCRSRSGPRWSSTRTWSCSRAATGSMNGLSLADGKTLWTAKHPRSGHASPEDLLVVQGLVWSGEIANGADTGIFTGRDLHTGQVKIQFPPDVDTYWFHHRCYRAKATDKYLLTSRTGIEFIDPATKHWEPHHWVRGGCLYGIMPGNGLVYAPPHSCGCYLESKLYGFNALAADTPSRRLPAKIADEGRLETGGGRRMRVARRKRGAGERQATLPATRPHFPSPKPPARPTGRPTATTQPAAAPRRRPCRQN